MAGLGWPGWSAAARPSWAPWWATSESDALELCFYALAGGAILYVIGEIWRACRLGHAELGLYMLGIGFLLGIATDLVVAYGGA